MPSALVTSARRVLEIEAQALLDLSRSVDGDFETAVNAILSSRGRAIVTGMGKSGIIAHKVSATLMSTGTPSYFLHPAEAYHGDLGMITPDDIVIALSNSGETEEVVKLLPFLRDNGNSLIAMTGNPRSTLGGAADVHLDVHVEQEACPLQLAPTSSTTAALAMGDALAVALMEARGFNENQFARFHPGGSLGRRLLSKVEDEMLPGPLQSLAASADFAAIVSAITMSNVGLTVVTVDGGYAVITDGDLRRAVNEHGQDVFRLTAGELMTVDPAAVHVGTRMEDALLKMGRDGVSALLVFDGADLVGILKK